MQPNATTRALSWPRHLIQIEGMAPADIQAILDTANSYVERNRARVQQLWDRWHEKRLAAAVRAEQEVLIERAA